jgi:TolB-like protein/Tfp pilus assembly protein PilF
MPQARSRPDPSPPGAEEVRAQVERIVSSDVFRRAGRQSRFLRYIVDRALAGTTDRLKGYTIGIDVFDRGEDFDPNMDSIVRVEAGRLRTKLRDYYQAHGTADPVIIELPLGTYAPVMRRRGTAVGDAPKGTSRADPGSVAVLPFRNLSADPAKDWFSDGLTDALLTVLARNPHLKVISLTSVMRFKNTERPLREIAEELSVRHVVEGTVLRDGDQVRVSAQLIDAASDRHVWADAFEREVASVIGVHRELAETISGHLGRELGAGGAGPRPEARAGINPEAWDLYLLGRSYRRRLTREGLEKATELFRKAIDLDMNFAAAYSGAASCYCALGSYGLELEAPERLIPAGLELSRRAMEMDPGQVEPVTFTAIMTLKYEWNWPEAERLFRKALTLSPNDARTHLQYSLYFESLGKRDRAIAEAEQARNLDPLSTEANMNLAWQLHQAGREQEALERLNWTLDLNPGFWGAHWGLGHVLLALGKKEEALGEFRKAVETRGGYCTPLQGLGYARALCGDSKGALEILHTLDGMAAKAYVSPCTQAAIHAGLGDADACFERLERAFELRARSLAWINVAREYEPLRADPRFADLVRRIGIPKS